MKIITNVEFIETDKTIHEIFSLKPYDFLSNNLNEILSVEHVNREIIRGKRFIRYINGQREEIIIGVSHQAQEAIGVLYEAMDSLETANKLYNIENNGLRAIIKNFNRLSFWDRLKYLFKNLE